MKPSDTYLIMTEDFNIIILKKLKINVENMTIHTGMNKVCN